MKTIVRSCRDIRREIEEAGQSEPFTSAVDAHLKACGQCETFYDDQSRLRQIVSSLGTVAAPNDFEFRLRARLASEKRGAGQSYSIGNLSFGLRATAFATLLLLIGSALLFLSLRPATDASFIASSSDNRTNADSSQPSSGTPASARIANNGDGLVSPIAVGRGTDQSSLTDARLNSRGITDRRIRANRAGLKATQVASAGDRGRTRDMSSTAAPVLKPDDLVAAGHAVFPIDAAPQAMKVSVDNGRGSSKTVSLPGVSFGSQRVLTQNPSPLMASTRGAW